MPPHELSGTTAPVTGTRPGHGRAIATAITHAGAHLASAARNRGDWRAGVPGPRQHSKPAAAAVVGVMPRSHRPARSWLRRRAKHRSPGAGRLPRPGSARLRIGGSG
jgi:NAD(P)-dependent dehydrogenase (short-subunit alcohol dehydrogenase family)